MPNDDVRLELVAEFRKRLQDNSDQESGEEQAK
jgi:hypothetical protein